MLSDVRQHSGAYSGAVSALLKLPGDEQQLESTPALNRIQNILLIAQELGPEHGAGMVRDFYEQCSRSQRAAVSTGRVIVPRSGPREPWLSNLLQMRRLALEVLGKLEDATQINSVLDSLDSEDVATQVLMLQYLGEVARGNAMVKARLSKMVKDQGTTLYRDGLALRILELLDRPKDESEANDNERQGEKEDSLDQQDP